MIMNLKLWGPALFVKDILVSRQFYEGVLGFEPVMDNGPHVAYTGFSIWDSAMANGLIFNDEKRASVTDSQQFELCFTSGSISEEWEKANSKGCNIVSKLAEQPWSQLVFRLEDPDGHIMEIAEPLSQTLRRLLGQGLSMETVSEKTHMTIDAIEATLRQ